MRIRDSQLLLYDPRRQARRRKKFAPRPFARTLPFQEMEGYLLKRSRRFKVRLWPPCLPSLFLC